MREVAYPVLIFTLCIVLLSPMQIVSAAEQPALVTAIVSMGTPTRVNFNDTLNEFPNTTISKFQIPVVAEVINPTTKTITTLVTSSSHSRIYITASLDNSSIDYQDYFIHSPSTSTKTDVKPGRQQFNATGDLYFFNHTTEVLPDGNYTLHYDYGPDATTFYGHIEVSNGQYTMRHDTHTYTGNYTLAHTLPFDIYSSLLAMITVSPVIFVMRRRNKITNF